MKKTVITEKYYKRKERQINDEENQNHIKEKNHKKKENTLKGKNHKEKENQLREKANNKNSIRVLYKKAGQEPEIKIIDNLFKLKKAIVKYDLEILPFQNVYIVCHNKEQRKNMKINILLDFYSIAGDIIVLQIDKHSREFKSLSQENITWFTEVLNRRSPNNICHTLPSELNNKNNSFNLPIPNSKTTQVKNFEAKLLDVLTNINLTLSYLVMNNKK